MRSAPLSVGAPSLPAKPASPPTPSLPSSAPAPPASPAVLLPSTPQRPVKHASRQVPQEVRDWLGKEYPAVAARAKAEGAEIQWGDEMGVWSEATRQRGYAPRNDPPEQVVPGRRFRMNMISTITNEGKLRFMLYDGKMTGALFVVFLTRLVAGATRKIILIVDRLKVHAAEEVQVW